MSKLTKLLHRYQDTQLLTSMVEYLEHVELPGEAKKTLALAILKMLHVKSGGVWDKALENAIGGAIEYVLARVREAAGEFDEEDQEEIPSFPDPGPTGASLYGSGTPGELPTDEELLDMGYKTGDLKWFSNEVSAWAVTPASASMNAQFWNLIGGIGG